MKRIITLAFLAGCSALSTWGQPSLSREAPLISLYLPSGFASEKVQMNYFLTGPFGGYGSFIRPQTNLQTLDFIAAVNGKAAERVKIVAYLPGCELVVFDFPLAGTAMWRQLDCKPLGNLILHGRVPLAYATRKNKVSVSYQAEWAFHFFGIRDGMIPSIALSTVKTDESGQFAIEVPDFYKQKLGRGTYLLGFRCIDCGKQSDRNVRELPIASSYPSVDFAKQYSQ